MSLGASCAILLTHWFSFPTSLSCIGGSCSFCRVSSSMYASIPTMLCEPLPFAFHPPYLFSGIVFAPILRCPWNLNVSPDGNFPWHRSWVSLTQKSPIPRLPGDAGRAGYAFNIDSTKGKRVFFGQLLLCHSSLLLSIGKRRPKPVLVPLLLLLTNTRFSLLNGTFFL